MRARDLLAALYEDWRRLSEDEGQAISQGAWDLVDRCQTAKFELQARIIAASDRLQAEWAESPDRRAAEEPHFRQLVEQLICLESRNSERLASQRRTAEADRQALDKSTRSLRDIQRLYGGPRGPSWNSYS